MAGQPTPQNIRSTIIICSVIDAHGQFYLCQPNDSGAYLVPIFRFCVIDFSTVGDFFTLYVWSVLMMVTRYFFNHPKCHF